MNVKPQKKLILKFFNTLPARRKKGTAIARGAFFRTRVLRKKRVSISKHFLLKLSALLRL